MSVRYEHPPNSFVTHRVWRVDDDHAQPSETLNCGSGASRRRRASCCKLYCGQPNQVGCSRLQCVKLLRNWENRTVRERTNPLARFSCQPLPFRNFGSIMAVSTIILSKMPGINEKFPSNSTIFFGGYDRRAIFVQATRRLMTTLSQSGLRPKISWRQQQGCRPASHRAWGLRWHSPLGQPAA